MSGRLIRRHLNDRPELSKEPAYLVDIKYVGMSREEKNRDGAQSNEKYEADVHILSSLTISHGC